ncbi:MAG: hypothetical protein IIT53_14095 [Fibrobacter sp.]|nr:hypothetical protein [Fibrobacter sp.]
MKKILLCLAILAYYAAANTCTEAVFLFSKGSLDITQDEAYHDSSYFVENYTHKNEWSHKIYYTNGKIDSLVMDPMEDGEALRVTHYYWNSDEKISGKGSEMVIFQKTSGDTIILNEKAYSNGEFEGSYTAKITGSYISTLNSQYNSFTELYFSNDTLFEKHINDYGTDNPRPEIRFTIGDSTNDFKCYEYEIRDGKADLNETIEYVKTDNGFKIKYLEESSAGYYLREFFFVNSIAYTAIRKHRPAVKISPKARYFDLLGRYKFTK